MLKYILHIYSFFQSPYNQFYKVHTHLYAFKRPPQILIHELAYWIMYNIYNTYNSNSEKVRGHKPWNLKMTKETVSIKEANRNAYWQNFVYFCTVVPKHHTVHSCALVLSAPPEFFSEEHRIQLFWKIRQCQ